MSAENDGFALVGDIEWVFRAFYEGIPPATAVGEDERKEVAKEDLNAFYMRSMITLAKLKALNRTLHLSLDAKRKGLESKKTSIDQLQLGYENFLYRKAHLEKEIQQCKDLQTPNLDEIEKEVGHSLGATDFCDNLSAVHDHTLAVMQTERQKRLQVKVQLDELEEHRNTSMAQLDRKRKFVNTIPDHVAKLKRISDEVDHAFREFESGGAEEQDDEGNTNEMDVSEDS